MTKLGALPIPFGAGENQRIIYPVIASDAKHTVLIDTGFPGQLSLIQEAAAKAGIALENLTHIVITHHDMDHVGSLAAMKRTFPKAQIVSSAIEADYINGSKKSPRLENGRTKSCIAVNGRATRSASLCADVKKHRKD